jgi:hypothetical protein
MNFIGGNGIILNGDNETDHSFGLYTSHFHVSIDNEDPQSIINAN